MLTQNDLQQIRGVIKDEVRDAISEQIKPMIQEELKKELTPIKRKLNRVAKDLDYVIRSYDERLVAVETDVKKLKQN